MSCLEISQKNIFTIVPRPPKRSCIFLLFYIFRIKNLTHFLYAKMHVKNSKIALFSFFKNHIHTTKYQQNFNKIPLKNFHTSLCLELLIYIFIPHLKPVENSQKIIQKLFKKSVDISIFSRYYRGNFWIKKLLGSQKQKYSQNNSTLYTKRPVFLAVTGLFTCSMIFFYVSFYKNRVAIFNNQKTNRNSLSIRF